MVFIFIFLIFFLISIVFYFSKIKVSILNFSFDSNKIDYINKDYQVIIKLYILGKIPIIKSKITKQKLEELKIKEKFKNINLENLKKNIKIDKEFLKAIKKIDINIRKINLKINIGTENSAITSIIVPSISTIITIMLQKKIKKMEDQLFIIKPIYQNQNIVNIYISGIFEIKIPNIINIMYSLAKKEKKGVNKYERTSNRRPYDYGYE